jgi:hypothetical protein
MLRHRRNLEVLEDQDENENVINAQRILDHVTGEEFERLVRAADFPNHEIEQERENDPNRGALSGRPHAQFSPAMLELDKIDNQSGENAGMKRDPKPNTCPHRA